MTGFRAGRVAGQTAGLVINVTSPFRLDYVVWALRRRAHNEVDRFDAGPRVSMKVRNGMRVHFDWRQRIVGNAAPGSGPAVTLAGDF